MAPFTQPPERHLGYVCCKCIARSFLGRRYACWMCIDYQLCGNCYDTGELPTSPEHKYFHPLEVHYTRSEYELYFGGEGYAEANVPQSYKCAFCDSCGFTSIQLYKHLADTHRGHKDFDEYLSILYTRYTADASASSVAGAPPLVRIVPRATPRPASPQYNTPMVSFREAVQLTQQRRSALLEQNAINMLEELRVSRISTEAIVLSGLDQEQQRSLRTSRNPKTVRARILPQVTRLGGGMPSAMLLEPWSSDWVTPRNMIGAMQLQRQRPDRQLITYADVARQAAKYPPCMDNIKADTEEPELHKFLCAQFNVKEQKKRHQSQLSPNRSQFMEALLCSMLSEEQLSLIPVETVVIPVEPKPMQDESRLANETTTFSSPADDVMDRFYRGLENYTKWLAEFTKAKNSKDANISAVPNLIFQATCQPILDIDSDVDNDTDEREEEEGNGKDSEIYKILTIDSSIDESGQQVHESIEIVSIDAGDDDEDVEEEDEGEDEDDFESNSGAETSDSTIAMMVNVLD
ncbi:E3 ubiquitin-protein ligase KCMF1 [Drosophila innubila]|uniref:E3 ubiquitin-protein ligase KCMF1 n=1 Tax=Drosophila innubila TaxID=198719 RepID=UPI00148B7C4E|nr:E3 ubiquitin-protein ligase KCMF1 [Drosophila innubila]